MGVGVGSFLLHADRMVIIEEDGGGEVFAEALELPLETGGVGDAAEQDESAAMKLVHREKPVVAVKQAGVDVR